LVEEKIGYVRGPKGMLHLLVMYENGYTPGTKRIFYLLFVDVNRYDLFLHEGQAINRGRKGICPN
jgi:hypothetical protein